MIGIFQQRRFVERCPNIKIFGIFFRSDVIQNWVTKTKTRRSAGKSRPSNFRNMGRRVETGTLGDTTIRWQVRTRVLPIIELSTKGFYHCCVLRLEKEAMVAQTQSMLRPRPLASSVNRNSIAGTPDSKDGLVGKGNTGEDVKERVQRLMNQNRKGAGDANTSTPNAKSILQPSGEGNVIRKFITSTPLNSSNPQVFKVFGKSGKIFGRVSSFGQNVYRRIFRNCFCRV